MTNAWLSHNDLRRLNILDSAYTDKVVELLGQYDVVGMDNLYSLFPGTDNAPHTSGQYWQHVERVVQRIKQMGTCIVVADHMAEHEKTIYKGPGDEEFRSAKLQGTVNKRWTSDTTLALLRPKEWELGCDPSFLCSFEPSAFGKLRGEYVPGIHKERALTLKAGWLNVD
jgi:hypothetical protein